jgi:hypothetical protein
MPYLENDGTEATEAPTDCTKLFGIIVLLVDPVDLIEAVLRFVQADAVLPFDLPALRSLELDRVGV